MMIYFMLGMALILLSSNMEFVTRQLNTDVAVITFLISIEGLVRSATVYISGRLSFKDQDGNDYLVREDK